MSQIRANLWKMSNQEVSGRRELIHKILLVVAIPFVFFGLIDPLEGGISLLLGLLVYVAAFLIGSKRPAKYLWVSYVSSLSIGALVLGYALFRYLSTGDSGDFPIELVVGLVIYTGSVIITLAAAVFTAVKAFWPTKRTRP